MKNQGIYRKVSRGFQVTLPPKFRDAAHLNIGSTVIMKMTGGKLIIEPCVNDDKKASLQRLESIFQEIEAKGPFAGNEGLVQKAVEKEIKASRKSRSHK